VTDDDETSCSKLKRDALHQDKLEAVKTKTKLFNPRTVVKLLSAAGSAAVLFNGIKESWHFARKILSQFKLLWFLNVFW